MVLPTFRYHPDPLGTGSVKASGNECVCCNRVTGYIYDGPAYAEEDYEEVICPWCIADGSAHQKLGVTFTDDAGMAEEIPPDAVTVITERTPGFSSWQPEQWPGCCDDATAFLGPFGIAEIRRDHYEWEGFLMSYIVHELGISGGAAIRLLDSLHKDSGPTAYAFQCLHCASYHFLIDNL